MKNITNLKEKFCTELALSCKDLENLPDRDINLCPRRNACVCKPAAELKAYLHAILPKGFQNLSISDFKGLTDSDEKTLDDEVKKQRSEVAKKAKDQIANYCWGLTFDKWQELKWKEKKNMNDLSIMADRHENGNCVIVYGDSPKPMGRTMVASVIMREAIKRRFSSSTTALQTYDWIEYSALKSQAINKADSLADYQFCDWLVVDNFDLKLNIKAAAQNYITSSIDPFFIERIEKRLPTILVMRFDITRPDVNVQYLFGIGLDRMINDEDTFKISLS